MGHSRHRTVPPLILQTDHQTKVNLLLNNRGRLSCKHVLQYLSSFFIQICISLVLAFYFGVKCRWAVGKFSNWFGTRIESVRNQIDIGTKISRHSTPLTSDLIQIKIRTSAHVYSLETGINNVFSLVILQLAAQIQVKVSRIVAMTNLIKQICFIHLYYENHSVIFL